MKRLLLLLPLLCLLASPSWAAITEVASQRADATACATVDTCAVAFPNNVTAGNLIIVGGSAADGAANTFAVTDTVGSTYSTVACSTFSNGGLTATPFWAYAIAAASGANTVTVDPLLDASVNAIDFAIDEFTGVSATPLDVDGGSSTGTSTAPSDGIVTVTANDLLIGILGVVTTTITPEASFTQIGENQSSLDGYNFMFKILAEAAGADTVDWTIGDSVAWSACSGAFKEAIAAILQSPPTPPGVFQ